MEQDSKRKVSRRVLLTSLGVAGAAVASGGWVHAFNGNDTASDAIEPESHSGGNACHGQYDTWLDLQTASASGQLQHCVKVWTVQHTQGGIGGAVYVKDGTTGQANTGNEIAFYDGDGNGWRLDDIPTDARMGVLPTETLNESVAIENRRKIEMLLRDPSVAYCEFGIQGDVYVIGSIHPLRSNLYINHIKGCTIKGYLNDTARSTISVGHIFGFPLYQDPDNGNFTIIGYCENVNYQLDGEIATYYRAEHVAAHNNNCIGFKKSKCCRVVGSGGVGESDHKGIVFDGEAIDCHIDVAYIKETSNEPFQMKGDPSMPDCTNTVKVGSIENPKFDGGNPKVVGFVSYSKLVTVQIGKYTGNKQLNPILVGAFGCGTVIVEKGYVENVSQLLRQYETGHGLVRDVTFKNADTMIRRAGQVAGVHKTSRIQRCKADGGALPTIYSADYNGSLFDVLDISDNDFSEATGTVHIWNNPLSSGNPKVWDIKDNIVPSGWVNQAIFNKCSDYKAIAASGTSFSYDIEGDNGDRPYTQLGGRVVHGTYAYPFEFDLLLLSRTSYSFHKSILHDSSVQMKITTAKVGQNVTFTLHSGGTGATFGEIIVSN
ncbi:hypothetical protein [Paenibacillus oceani]|uniref:Uncharacterized protein n=1 Tax=Paenibacillus oceani TaxID=2772510 RepID=A0A927H361_9BACL|nr:hypothetical protein [Paenibacillus oceani]MBD2866088.1 hypothetical protein [Paenibacillus oceani]